MSIESLSLHRIVALEHHVHLIGRRQQWVRLLATAETSQRVAVWRVAVVNGNVIVGALLMGLNVKHLEQLSIGKQKEKKPLDFGILFFSFFTA